MLKQLRSIPSASRLVTPSAARPNSILLSAVRQGNKAYCWNTMPRSGPGPATGSPSIKMPPEVGWERPDARSSNVDLPHPLGPTRTMNSPAPTSKSTFDKATSAPAVAEVCLSGKFLPDALETDLRHCNSDPYSFCSLRYGLHSLV